MSDSSRGSTNPEIPIRVVVDTSVLRRTKGDLTSGDWPALLAAQHLGLFTLHIPTVVLHELVDHRRRDYGELIKLEREAHRLRSQLGETRRDELPRHLMLRHRTTQLCSEYSDAVSAWFSAPGSVLPDPAVTHSELVERVLARRRPFNESETGYRDALIWYTTLEQASGGRSILLSANTKDFARKTPEGHRLADDLIDDLVDRGLEPHQVTLITSTGELMRLLLPDSSDEPATSAWASFASSEEMIAALDDELDRGLGLQLAAAPPAPSFLWGIGLRAVSSITAVDGVRLVADDDGWFRVHSRIDVDGMIGGYSWAWGSPDSDDPEEYRLWDEWGGLTEYYASPTPRPASITVAARFRPPNELDAVEILEATADPAADPDVAKRANVRRHLNALQMMLATHDGDQRFLDDVLGENLDEFSHIVAGLLIDAAPVVATLDGRYPALTPDNATNALTDQAGLQAVERDLRNAIAAIDLNDARAVPE